jgi:hypothetical protein
MNRTEETISRVVQGFINLKVLFSEHPLLAWHLINSNAEGRKVFLDIVSDGQVGIHTTEDGWKDLGNHIKDKICHRFTK